MSVDKPVSGAYKNHVKTRSEKWEVETEEWEVKIKEWRIMNWK